MVESFCHEKEGEKGWRWRCDQRKTREGGRAKKRTPGG